MWNVRRNAFADTVLGNAMKRRPLSAPPLAASWMLRFTNGRNVFPSSEPSPATSPAALQVQPNPKRQENPLAANGFANVNVATFPPFFQQSGAGLDMSTPALSIVSFSAAGVGIARTAMSS